MSAPWWEGPMVPFDLETTGPQPGSARIVQYAIRGESALLNPGVPIPEGASGVHGITDEVVADEPGFRDHALRLYAALVECVDTQTPIVGFNLAYDFTVLDREFRRHQTGYRVPAGLLVIDAYVLDKAVDTYRKGQRRLANVAAHYGVTPESWHDSTADARASEGIAREIGRRYGAHDLMGLDMYLLHQRQVYWRWEQQKSLRAYFDDRGTEHDGCPGHWPIIPGEVED